MKIENSYFKEDFERWPRPSPMELAHLAARLVHSDKINYQQLVMDAWCLYWESCSMLKEDYEALQEDESLKKAQAEAVKPELPPMPEPITRPKKFPITYAQLERLLLPKLSGRTAKRASIMREFLFMDYLNSQVPGLPPAAGKRPLSPAELELVRKESEEQRAEIFGTLRAKTYDEHEFDSISHYFHHWYRQSASFKKSLVRSASARKRWSERRGNKQDKTGAKPNYAALKEILDPPKKIS